MEGSSNKMLKSNQSKVGDLPDSVLHLILSFLDMKEVVGTSLVSRRWRYLWASIPVLNFDHHMWNKVCTNNDKRSKQGFMNFVDRVLFLRDGSRVSKFRIICSNFCDSDRVAAWLTVAARREFKEIDLTFRANKQIKLPNFLFTTAIAAFKLRATAQARKCLIEAPNSVSLSPHLKILRLDLVQFPKGNSGGEFMLSCPVLETLGLINCNQRHLKALIISVPQLKNLVIENQNHRLVGSCHISIWTPNLLSLYCTGLWYSNCSLMNYPSLHIAQILIGKQLAPQFLVKLLEAVSCAKRIELYFRDLNMLTKLTSQFLNLRYLKLYFYCGKKLSIRVLLKLLKNAPHIESLTLEALKLNDYDEEVVPFECSHLKNVEITGIDGSEYEVKFLKFLLKSAVVLEKLMIKICNNSNGDMGEYLWSEVISLHRASSGITIVIV